MLVSVERVNSDEESNLLRLAQALEADLRFVGIDVVQTGDYFSGSADLQDGFVIFYDPSAADDASAGVFVRWRPSSELLAAARESGDMDSMPVVVGGLAMEAMTETLQKIMEAMGWQVEPDLVGVHESSLKVSRRQDTKAIG